MPALIEHSMPATGELLVNCKACRRVCWAPGPRCPTCVAREEFVALHPAVEVKPAKVSEKKRKN